jgi:hypothetical protein
MLALPTGRASLVKFVAGRQAPPALRWPRGRYLQAETPHFATGKRRREALPTVEDLLCKARMIMERDPFKTRAPQQENHNFRALFGCGAEVALILWNMLVKYEVVPPKGTMTQFLWMLLYCKTYASWKAMQILTNTDPKTLRKWLFNSDGFIAAVAQLEPYVVSIHLQLLLCYSNSTKSCSYSNLLHRFSGAIAT